MNEYMVCEYHWKEEVLNFQIPPLERSPSSTAVLQRQLRTKWLLCSTRFFLRRLLCSVRFVFVSTFNLQRGRSFVVGITNL